MRDALVIKGLNKRFGGLRAVQDVSFTVKENETVALIGPNGNILIAKMRSGQWPGGPCRPSGTRDSNLHVNPAFHA